MPLCRADFGKALAVVGSIWITVFLSTGCLPGHHCPQPQPPHSNSQILSGLSLPALGRLFASITDSAPQETLRGEMRVKCIGREGGTMRCGPAELHVPPDAVSRATLFLLEDISDHMPAVEFEQSATDLIMAPRLTLSYAGTPYDSKLYDASGLRIYRELGPGIFEPVASHADLQLRGVIGSIMANGRYVIG